MEQKEKNQEMPEWVKIVGELPGSIQEVVGRSCAGTIASLVQIYFISKLLYEQLIQEADKQIRLYNED